MDVYGGNIRITVNVMGPERVGDGHYLVTLATSISGGTVKGFGGGGGDFR
jgi:hypothetical protein